MTMCLPPSVRIVIAAAAAFVAVSCGEEAEPAGPEVTLTAIHELATANRHEECDRYFHLETDHEIQFLRFLLASAKSQHAMNEALDKRFPRGDAEPAWLGLMECNGVYKTLHTPVERWDTTATGGETAEAVIKGGDLRPVRFNRVGEHWLIEPASLRIRETAHADVFFFMPKIPPMLAAFTAEVEAGKFATRDAALLELARRWDAMPKKAQ